ncbi:DUF742 domain-containing protein [Streptomyces sp. CC228A]|uniref:DUF742 domain-containing protein n=1 Tax=Streptomyces sp. CC228A TaxID=2898186 RepID=UPI001F398F8C|nr:DUF742 domain-containing protein [Streptomyces sp. CC228A]
MTLENQGPWDESAPVPLYLISGARGSTARSLDLVTLITSRSSSQSGMPPEESAILTMCHYPLSVAELSAHLSLPFSVVTVLVAKLIEDERVEATAPVPVAAVPEIGLLEAVIHGLRKL